MCINIEQNNIKDNKQYNKQDNIKYNKQYIIDAIKKKLKKY